MEGRNLIYLKTIYPLNLYCCFILGSSNGRTLRSERSNGGSTPSRRTNFWSVRIEAYCTRLSRGSSGVRIPYVPPILWIRSCYGRKRLSEEQEKLVRFQSDPPVLCRKDPPVNPGAGSESVPWTKPGL